MCVGVVATVFLTPSAETRPALRISAVECTAALEVDKHVLAARAPETQHVFNTSPGRVDFALLFGHLFEATKLGLEPGLLDSFDLTGQPSFHNLPLGFHVHSKHAGVHASGHVAIGVRRRVGAAVLLKWAEHIAVPCVKVGQRLVLRQRRLFTNVPFEAVGAHKVLIFARSCPAVDPILPLHRVVADRAFPLICRPLSRNCSRPPCLFVTGLLTHRLELALTCGAFNLGTLTHLHLLLRQLRHSQERVHKSGSRGQPRLRINREQLDHQGFAAAGFVRFDGCTGGECALQLDQLGGLVDADIVDSGCQPNHHAKSVHVRRCRLPLPTAKRGWLNLRSHVLDRPLPDLCRHGRGRDGDGPLVDALANVKVAKHRPCGRSSVRHEDVLQLDVAMHHPLRVQILNPAADLVQHDAAVCCRRLARSHPLSHVPADIQWHVDECLGLVAAHLVHNRLERDDARVVQLVEDERLFSEPIVSASVKVVLFEYARLATERGDSHGVSA
mmetsp:Transcript_24789/g.74510  ORF Transcript_24789/g.74510 Transcript_24789/m.74510 type:complete len:500 (-) Transcript_24789:74-1573(-)